MDSLTFTLSVGMAWNAQSSISAHGSNTNQSTLAKSLALGTAAANAAAGGSNELYSTLLTIAGGGSTTLDLTSLTNILGASISFARIKTIVIRLLSTTDDSTNGSACSSITVGAAASNQFTGQSKTGFFENTTDEVVIPNGGFLAWGVGNAAGVAVDSTHKSLKILNDDATVSAKVLITLVGGSS